MTKQIGKRQTAQFKWALSGWLKTSWALALPFIGVALFSGLAAAGQNAPIPTRTSLAVVSGPVGNHTAAIFTTTVRDANGAPASGVVTLFEDQRGVASVALDETGTATLTRDSLAPGDHQMRAVYSGDKVRAESNSDTLSVHANAAATPDFSVAISPTSLTMAAGGSGTTVLTVTPLNGFTGFLSLSCSGLPVDEINCTFTPINLQVVSPTTPVKADLSVVTLAPGGTSGANRFSDHLNDRNTHAPLTLAFLLPGIAVLGFAGRKRKLFSRVALLALVGVLSITTMTACAARYKYLHHGPVVGGTPPGNYTLTVTAQTSDGVTATEHSTTLAVTVN